MPPYINAFHQHTKTHYLRVHICTCKHTIYIHPYQYSNNYPTIFMHEVIRMVDVEYGQIKLKIADIMKEQNISINKLAFRAEMQRTQLKAYLKGDVQRVDLSVLSRLCYALECNLTDLIEYIPPKNK